MTSTKGTLLSEIVVGCEWKCVENKKPYLVLPADLFCLCFPLFLGVLLLERFG
jgi:hypothetical protein